MVSLRVGNCDVVTGISANRADGDGLSDFPFALQYSHNRGFSNPSGFPVDHAKLSFLVHESGCSADISFVRFHFSSSIPREIQFPCSRVRATVLGNPETETLPSLNI